MIPTVSGKRGCLSGYCLSAGALCAGLLREGCMRFFAQCPGTKFILPPYCPGEIFLPGFFVKFIVRCHAVINYVTFVLKVNLK